MGFRRDGEKARAWHYWLDRNRNMLIKSGLPDFLYSDESTWFRFLEHDGWHQENGWKVEMLAPHEAAVFVDFIKCEYGEEEYRFLLRSLENKGR